MDGRGYPFVMQHPYWEHGGDGHPLAHILLLILFVVLLVTAAVFLYRLLRQPRTGFVPAVGGVPPEALGVARLRYARGEIDRAEFRRISADLGAPLPEERPGEAPAAVSEPAAGEAAPPADAPTQ